ncbi:ALP1-like protein [Tanacetum coccineum]
MKNHKRNVQERTDLTLIFKYVLTMQEELAKCTSVIRQMTYDIVRDALHEYLQMGATTARVNLVHFSNAVMELYGREYLRQPIYTDMEKLYAHHEQKHGFPGMIGNVDCTDWPWENCPNAFRA